MGPLNDPNFLARRAHWDRRCKPFPQRQAVLPFQRTFSAEEAQRLAYGLIPEAMEDKWFIILRDDTLDFHRSWTGHHIYRLPMARTPDGLVAGSLLVNDDREQHGGEPGEFDLEMVNILIQWVLAPPDEE